MSIYLPILVIVNIFPDRILELYQVFISSWISKISSPSRLQRFSQNLRDIHEKKYLWCIFILKFSRPVSLFILWVFKYPVNRSPNILPVQLVSSQPFLVRNATSPAGVLEVRLRPVETVLTLTELRGTSPGQTLVDSLLDNTSFRYQIYSRVKRFTQIYRYFI